MEPYRFNKGSKERREIWNQIASNLNGIPDSGLNTTQRGVRAQYDKLKEDFVKKEREEKKATVIDTDYELDQLLNDTHERESDAAADLARQAEEKEKAACDEKQQAEDIRTQAMESQEKKATKQKEKHSTKRVVRGRTKIQE